MLLGDFSCVLSSRDKTSETTYRDASSILLAETVDEIGLTDVGECLESTRDVRFTHFQGGSHARLDRFYFSLNLI